MPQTFLAELISAMEDHNLAALIARTRIELDACPWWSYFRTRELREHVELLKLCADVWTAGYSAGVNSVTQP